MFGLLDLRSCNLSQNIQSHHACGVCNALACKFGRASRIMLNNDSVYLSLLMASQRTEVSHHDLTQARGCRQWSNISVPCPDSQYPAAVSVLLGGAKLIDDSHDECSFRSKILLALHEANIRKAENAIRDVGLPPLEALIRQQHKRERDRGRELAYYSQTTEEVYSKVLSHTAELADAPTNYDALAKVGLHLGRIAYLLDSYADLPEDISAGRFNPIRALSPKAPASLMTNPKRLLTHHSRQSLHVIREAMKSVKLRRFRDIITHVVTDGLEAKVQRVMMGLESPFSRPIAYLVAPLTILTALRLFTPVAKMAAITVSAPQVLTWPRARRVP